MILELIEDRDRVAVADFPSTVRRLHGRDARLETEYQNRQRNFSNERSKQPQRERVMDHILRHHETDRRMRLFSLPGIGWEFEKQLDENWARPLDFVAVDWSYGVIELGICNAPGRNRRTKIESLKIGNIYGYRTDRARWMWSHVSSFFSLGRSVSSKKRHRRRFSEKYRRFTAVWLDFTSQICTEVLEALPRLSAVCCERPAIVPVAVTVMLAREPQGCLHESDGDVLQRRVKVIERALNQGRFRSFETTDAWSYLSDSSVPMGVVCGLLRVREQELSVPNFPLTAGATHG